jgi:hypothetical protein
MHTIARIGRCGTTARSIPPITKNVFMLLVVIGKALRVPNHEGELAKALKPERMHTFEFQRWS